MNLFLVTDETGRERWVAYEDPIAEHLFVYVANTGAFHRNDSVGVDYYYDQRLTYEPIDVARAAAKIAEGLGRIDERKAGWLAERYRADQHSRSVESVLGARSVEPQSARARAQRFAQLLGAAKPGVWVTYKAYPAVSRQLAHVAAYDVRQGNVRAIAKLGPVLTQVVDGPGGQVEVQVARAAARLKPRVAKGAKKKPLGAVTQISTSTATATDWKGPTRVAARADKAATPTAATRPNPSESPQRVRLSSGG